jgi:hypothetical protein
LLLLLLKADKGAREAEEYVRGRDERPKGSSGKYHVYITDAIRAKTQKNGLSCRYQKYLSFYPCFSRGFVETAIRTVVDIGFTYKMIKNRWKVHHRN